jgi:iron complex outermembrane receptor protein
MQANMRTLALTVSTFVVITIAGSAAAQPSAETRSAALAGRVLDAAGNGIPEVSVSVVELRRGAFTGADGRFAIPAIPFGTYHVSFQRLGFATEVRHFAFTGESLAVRLRESLIEIPGAQVTATPSPTEAMTSPQPTSVLGGEQLHAALQPSLGATLEGLPGVRSWSTGSGIGKPSIRGLRSDRVLVVSEGQRLENQQWGDEHGPQVETASIERIEVIRGPASVLYGSDALGGVVNVIHRELPTAFDRGPFVRGSAFGAVGSVDDQREGGATIEGGAVGFGWRAGFTARNSDDVRTPTGSLFNSGNEAVTGTGAVGWRGGSGSVDGGYTHREETVQIHEDPAEDPTATPFQDIVEDHGHVRLLLPTGRDQRLQIRGGLERNQRREYEAETDDEFALGLTATTGTADVQYTHPGFGPLEGVVGISWFNQEFEKSGEESLIPNSSVWNVGLFAFEQFDRDPWHGSFGLRYDHRELEAEDDADLGMSAQTRTWDAVTGNVGVLYRAHEGLAVVANCGRGFRAPSSFDLFANGVHEGTVAYEIGDPGLAVEQSINVDVAVRVQADRVRAEFGGFLNTIQDFIYSRPTGVIDPGSGFEIFRVVQGDARLMGFEVSAEWHPSQRWHVTGTAEHVVGDNTGTDTPLPWIPPFRGQLGVRWELAPIAGRFESHIGVRGEYVAEQTRLDPFDFGTDAYALTHLEAAVSVPAGSGEIELDLTVRNLFDETYRDFMSRYKTYADAPARSVVARITARY